VKKRANKRSREAKSQRSRSGESGTVTLADESSSAALLAHTAPLARPHDPGLADLARELWLSGDWRALSQISNDAVLHHPDRAQLTAFQAAAALQRGDRANARDLSRRALQWGCSRETLARALLSGARHILARASVLARREAQSMGHFERALVHARLPSEVRRLSQSRRDRVDDDLRQAINRTTQCRALGSTAAVMRTPKWVIDLADQCLQTTDLHEAVDRALKESVPLADDRLQLLMVLSDQMVARNDRMTAMHFLVSARWFVEEAQSEHRVELTRKLVALGAPETAMDIVMRHALQAQEGTAASRVTTALHEAYQGMRQAASARLEHGHELLLAHLEVEGDRLRGLASPRKITLIEIGTTREDVPGQGSTQKLAEYCQRHQMHFVTVDMDPHNTHMAKDCFRRLGAHEFDAVTMKGEDYLRDRQGDIDLVFLDAYDFDHGQHSELRQSRYERYLGARIDEQACHRMHLHCATTLADKLWRYGVVCIDDTWLEDGAWSAKGTLAMPFLLNTGFMVKEARNRAALLLRSTGTST